MNINPHIAAQWVEQRASNTQMRPLRDVLTEVLAAELRCNSKRSISDEEVSELSEGLVSRVAECLSEQALTYIDQGITPSFDIDLTELYYCCKVTPESVFLRKLHAMTPRGFEFFCRKILIKLGGTANVSGGSNDECVDFFSVGMPLTNESGPFPVSARLVVIGQAKKWKLDNQVGLNDLREFVGGAQLRAHSLRGDYSDRFGLITATTYAYWVTCDFSQGARDYANRMGLWYLNGKGLAQLGMRTGITEIDIPGLEAEALGAGRPNTPRSIAETTKSPTTLTAVPLATAEPK